MFEFTVLGLHLSLIFFNFQQKFVVSKKFHSCAGCMFKVSVGPCQGSGLVFDLGFGEASSMRVSTLKSEVVLCHHSWVEVQF